jgi:uncharacterized membrane protein YgcG
MPHRGRWVVGLIALSLCLVLVAGANAVAPVVKDDAKLFSAEAVKKANEQIREIYQKFDRDLLVETYASVPADDVEKVKKMDKEERAKYFQKWAIERAKETVVNGVYVLICKEPTYLYVEVTPKARKVFNEKAMQKLRELFLGELREKRFDDALLGAAKMVQETLAKKTSE